MNKAIPVIIVAILLITGGTGYYLYSQKSKPPIASTATSNTTNTNVFSSIQDALSKSLSLQCTFNDDQNRKTTAYIKAGAIRADVTGNDQTQQYNNSSVIIRDKKMYIWDNTKKQGMMMDLKNDQVEMAAGNTQGNDNGNGQSPQNAGDVMAA